jgi:hypothetical protein
LVSRNRRYQHLILRYLRHFLNRHCQIQIRRYLSRYLNLCRCLYRYRRPMRRYLFLPILFLLRYLLLRLCRRLCQFLFRCLFQYQSLFRFLQYQRLFRRYCRFPTIRLVLLLPSRKCFLMPDDCLCCLRMQSNRLPLSMP